jgi:hypothetical protein
MCKPLLLWLACCLRASLSLVLWTRSPWSGRCLCCTLLCLEDLGRRLCGRLEDVVAVLWAKDVTPRERVPDDL